MGGNANNATVQKRSSSQNHATQGGSKATRKGEIKHLNYSKGYGFIASPDFEGNVFVHFSDCIDRIKKGDQVSFEVILEERGPRAKDVKLLA